MVLIVEDDKNIAEMISHVMVFMGLKFDFATSNLEALAKLNTYTYRVVLLDMLLSDGLAEPIIKKCQSSYPKTRIVLMTALSKEHTSKISDTFQIHDILSKPFCLNELEKYVS